MNEGASRAGRVLLVSALLWTAILGGSLLVLHRGDVRGFFVAGNIHRTPALAGWPVRDGPGYDGQYFAVLATDPLLLANGTAAGLDAPGYRAGRIGLPLTAWLLALGNPRIAPIVYLVLAWLLGLLGVWVAARWLEDLGRSPWEALPLALSGGLVASAMRGTPDAAAASFILLALWLEERRSRGSIPALAFAALARETSLVGAAGVAVARWRDGRRRAAVAAVAVPAGVVAGWRLWVRSRPGFPPQALDLFASPLAWLPAKFAPPWTADSIAEAAAVAALALAVAAWVALLPEWRRWTAAGWTYAGFCLLALVLGWPVYEDRWAFARVFVALPLLAAPLAAQANGRMARRLLRAVPWTWAVAGVLSLALSTRLAAVLTRAFGR